MFDQLDISRSAVSETTLRSSVSCEGIGLHTGRPVVLRLIPAPAGTGIVFRRQDLLTCRSLEAQPESLAQVSIRAIPDSVRETQLGTTLVNDHGVSIATTEHLMAAFAGLGVDNALVEVEGPEVPIMDGSSAPFITLIDKAGLRALSTPRRAIRILDTIEVRDGDRWARALPSLDAGDLGWGIDVTVDYADPAIGCQRAGFTVTPRTFRDLVAPARTFCNRKDVEAMHARGLALGGSFDNAIVVNDGRIENDGGLRVENEFAHHKALDVIGDLYLLGCPIIGRIAAYKPGHDLNTRLAQAIAAQPDSVALVSLPQFAAEDGEVGKTRVTA